MSGKYWPAPIRNPPPKDTKSWEERGYDQGYQYGLDGAKLKEETRAITHSPIMQGYRAGDKERRLKNLLLKKR